MGVKKVNFKLDQIFIMKKFISYRIGFSNNSLQVGFCGGSGAEEVVGDGGDEAGCEV